MPSRQNGREAGAGIPDPPRTSPGRSPRGRRSASTTIGSVAMHRVMLTARKLEARAPQIAAPGPDRHVCAGRRPGGRAGRQRGRAEGRRLGGAVLSGKCGRPLAWPADRSDLPLYAGGYTEGAAIPERIAGPAGGDPRRHPAAARHRHRLCGKAAGRRRGDDDLFRRRRDFAGRSARGAELGRRVPPAGRLPVPRTTSGPSPCRGSAQTASRTLAQKALAYGMPGIQVDGNDLPAVHAAARRGGGPGARRRRADLRRMRHLPPGPAHHGRRSHQVPRRGRGRDLAQARAAWPGSPC